MQWDWHFYKSLLSNYYALCLVLLLADFFKQSFKIRLAKNSDKIHLIPAHTQPIYRPLEICTGCKSIFRKFGRNQCLYWNKRYLKRKPWYLALKWHLENNCIFNSDWLAQTRPLAGRIFQHPFFSSRLRWPISPSHLGHFSKFFKSIFGHQNGQKCTCH